MPLAIDQEFLEVPADFGLVAGLSIQPAVEGLFTVARDWILFKEIKGGFIFELAELFDFPVGSGFLSAEVIARKTHDLKTLAFVFLVGLLQSSVLRNRDRSSSVQMLREVPVREGRRS